MTQMRDALERAGIRTTDWHKVQTSVPADAQAAHGMGHGNGHAVEPSCEDDADVTALELERDELLREKQTNLAWLAEARARISGAKSRVYTRGVYSDPDWFIALQRRVAESGQRDQMIGRRLGIIRQAIGRRRREGIVDDADPASLLKLAMDHIARAIELLNRKS
jgi:hypothetical protein